MDSKIHPLFPPTLSTHFFPTAHNTTLPHPKVLRYNKQTRYTLTKTRATMETTGCALESILPMDLPPHATRRALESILPADLPPHVIIALNSIVNTSNELARRMGTFNDPTATIKIRRELIAVSEAMGIQVNIPFGILRARQDTMIKPYIGGIQKYFKMTYGFDFGLTFELLNNVLTARSLKSRYLDKSPLTSGGGAASGVLDNRVADPAVPVSRVQTTSASKSSYVEPKLILGTLKPRPTRRVMFEGMCRAGTSGFVLDPYDNFDLFVELVGGSAKGMQFSKDDVEWSPLGTREQYVALWLGVGVGLNRVYLRRVKAKKIYPDVKIERVIDEAFWASDEAMYL